MKSKNISAILLLISAALFACAPAHQVSSFIPENQQAILNGKIVTSRETDEAKSIVLIEVLDRKYSPLALCTGTLLAANVALTAAHCFDPKVTHSAIGSFNILFETSYSRYGRRNVRRGISRVTHPRYNTLPKDVPMFDHDLALVTFEGELPPWVRFASLQTDSSVDFGGRLILAYGYGRSVDYNGVNDSDRAESAGILRTGTMKIDDDYMKNPGQFYLTDPHSMKHCQGDSGGPEFVRTERGMEVVGVNSSTLGPMLANHVQSCAEGSIATKISPFAPWILSQKEKLSLKTKGKRNL